MRAEFQIFNWIISNWHHVSNRRLSCHATSTKRKKKKTFAKQSLDWRKEASRYIYVIWQVVEVFLPLRSSKLNTFDALWIMFFTFQAYRYRSDGMDVWWAVCLIGRQISLMFWCRVHCMRRLIDGNVENVFLLIRHRRGLILSALSGSFRNSFDFFLFSVIFSIVCRENLPSSSFFFSIEWKWLYDKWIIRVHKITS